MQIPFNNLGAFGLVKDVFPHDAPVEAWTGLVNARMGAFGAERFLGHTRTLGTGTAGWTQQPLWLFFAPVAGADDLWIGAGATKVYCRSANTPFTEANITRQSVGVDVNYASDDTKKWNGGMFGGLAILNNGADEPQLWSPVSAGQRLVNLSTVGTGAAAWPSTYRARCMRPFGRFLVGIDITKSGTRYPQLIKWSHPSDPGAAPTSWDTTDPSKDAGEYPLNDAAGDLVDQLVLRNLNILYTTGDVWAMTYVGGNNIFRFDRLFSEQGALFTNCVAAFKRKGEFHAVLSGDDIYIHNGQSPQSVVTPQMRRWFFQQIDPNFFQRSFVVANPVYSEIWVCVPQLGAEQPTLALVWNWDTGAIGLRDLLKITSNGDSRSGASTQGSPCIAQGFLSETVSEPWSSDTEPWDSDTTIWDARTTSPATQRLFMQDRSAGNRTFLLDNGASFDTASFSWELERTGLSALGKGRDGEPIFDVKTIKQVTALWPRVEAPAGTVLDVTIGTQDTPDAAVAWSDTLQFTVGTDLFVPVFASGRYISVKIRNTGAANIRLLGYALEVSDAGEY